MEIEEHDVGLTCWVGDEPMRRAWHALADDGRVWLVDPIDDAAALTRVAALGAPAGVIQLLDRHNRDCRAIAERLGVPHHRLPDALPGTPFEVVRVLGLRVWKESALWWPATRTLVVAETVGTGPMFRRGAVPAGIHIFLRPRPPGALRRYDPEHLLVGHGRALHGADASRGLREAYARSWRDLPGVVAGLAKLGR